MIKYGEVTTESLNDFSTKKAAYYDAEGEKIADEAHKSELKKPTPIILAPDYG